MATPLGIEIFATVAGPLRMLDERPKPITETDLRKSAGVEAKIGKDIRAWLDQEEPAASGEEPEELDYFDTLEKLSAARPELEELERGAALVSGLPDPSVGAEYLAHFKKVKAFLARVMPKRKIVTLAGGEQPVEPSDIELSAFWRAWEAAEDPRVLLRDMREGILVSDQVAVAAELYPMMYAVMCQQAIAAMGERRGKDDEYEPAGWQEQQLETLLQVSRLSPELAADLQARARRAEQQERSAEQQGPTQGPNLQDKPIDALQTPVQRLAQR